MKHTQIRCEIEQNLMTITLNRPELLNSFTTTMLEELLEALDLADANDAVRAVIFTGAGRAYCAGADLSSGAEAFYQNRPGETDPIDTHRDGGGRLVLRIFESKKPVIAAINGPAVGVGITMTLPMDIRIASSAARMGFVFARRGIVPEACSTWFLPRLVGIGRAAEWVYTGRVFSADEALAGGLLSRVVPPEELMNAARALAEEIASNTSAMSVALSRQLLWRMLGADHPIEAHKIDSKCIYWMAQSPDAREGVAAFFEKRAPHFTLRPGKDMPPFYPWWPKRPFR